MKPIKGIIQNWRIEHGQVYGLFIKNGSQLENCKGICTSSIQKMISTVYGPAVETKNSIYILGAKDDIEKEVF